MLIKVGIMLLFIGSMMGDSENLIVPIAFILTGAALVLIGRRTDHDKYEDTEG